MGLLFGADIFLGAEFTQTYAVTYGSGMVLNKGAEYVSASTEQRTVSSQRYQAREKVMALGAMTLLTMFILLRARQKNKAPF